MNFYDDLINCGKCKHWASENEETDVGQCRRFPPVLLSGQIDDTLDHHKIAKLTVFPCTSYVEVCREFSIAA